MALTRQDKERIVTEVSQVAARAQSLVAANYRGLSMPQLLLLRRQAREQGVYLRVVKNNLAHRAFEGNDLACANKQLKGPLLFCFSEQEPAAGARLLRDFSKEHELLELKFGVLDGVVLDVSEVRKLADLPTRDQALSQLMSVMQAPIAKFVRTCNEIPGQLVRVTAAYRSEREAAS